MGRVFRCNLALVLALFAARSSGETVIWLPVGEPVGYYSFPLGGLSWSPDGEHIAYTWHEYWPPQYHFWELRLLALDATYRRCEIEWSAGHAAWSPLQSSIAVGNAGRITILNSENCQVTLDSLVIGGDPAWSHDGRRIAFATDSGIAIVAAGGGREQYLVSNASQPAWSPDDSSIVFVRSESTGLRSGNLWSISIDGTNERQLTRSGEDDWPTWSPDGLRIAFSRPDSGVSRWSIWIVDTKGGEPTRFTSNQAGESRSRPAWSWDGKRLAYFLFRDTQPHAGVAIADSMIPSAIEVRTWGRMKRSYR